MRNFLSKVYRRVFVEFYENLRVQRVIHRLHSLNDFPESGKCSVVIFSKDRPLQLEALIKSLSYFCDSSPPVDIIYNSSDEKFEDAYKKLFYEKNDLIRSVHSDKDGFKATLLKTLKSSSERKIFFLVDDIIFKKHFKIEDFLKFGREFVPSLRMGLHLKRSYTQNRDQAKPHLTKGDPDFYTWKFKEGKLDWGYPLSVDGHIFYRDEIILMTEALDFKAPNSYEAKLQKFNKFFKKRYGVCHKVSVTLNIPCNKVQVENENIFGSHHQDDLLKVFSEKMIDIEAYENFENESCHQEVSLRLIDREQG